MTLHDFLKEFRTNPLSSVNGVFTTYLDVAPGRSDADKVITSLQSNFDEERKQNEPYNFFVGTPDAYCMFPTIFGPNYEKNFPGYFNNLPVFGELAFIQRTQEGDENIQIFGRNGIVNMCDLLDHFGLPFPDPALYFHTVIGAGDTAYRTRFPDGTRELAVFKPDLDFDKDRTAEVLIYRYNIHQFS